MSKGYKEVTVTSVDYEKGAWVRCQGITDDDESRPIQFWMNLGSAMSLSHALATGEEAKAIVYPWQEGPPAETVESAGFKEAVRAFIVGEQDEIPMRSSDPKIVAIHAKAEELIHLAQAAGYLRWLLTEATQTITDQDLLFKQAQNFRKAEADAKESLDAFISAVNSLLEEGGEEAWASLCQQ